METQQHERSFSPPKSNTTPICQWNGFLKLWLGFTLFMLTVTSLYAQSSPLVPISDTATYHSIEAFRASKTHISIETDPAFWLSTLPNGLGFDANVNLRLGAAPCWRFGLLGYSGIWSGSLAKTLLLTSDFPETNWTVRWRGAGIETQYQFRLGLSRGGLQPGVRLQWNQFEYRQSSITLATANHFVITPQVGFQWFPFQKLGLYVLPWAGFQLPVAGTHKLHVAGTERATRHVMPVITAHVGWEFDW